MPELPQDDEVRIRIILKNRMLGEMPKIPVADDAEAKELVPTKIPNPDPSSWTPILRMEPASGELILDRIHAPLIESTVGRKWVTKPGYQLLESKGTFVRSPRPSDVPDDDPALEALVEVEREFYRRTGKIRVGPR